MEPRCRALLHHVGDPIDGQLAAVSKPISRQMGSHHVAMFGIGNRCLVGPRAGSRLVSSSDRPPIRQTRRGETWPTQLSPMSENTCQTPPCRCPLPAADGNRFHRRSRRRGRPSGWRTAASGYMSPMSSQENQENGAGEWLRRARHCLHWQIPVSPVSTCTPPSGRFLKSHDSDSAMKS